MPRIGHVRSASLPLERCLDVGQRVSWEPGPERPEPAREVLRLHGPEPPDDAGDVRGCLEPRCASPDEQAGHPQAQGVAGWEVHAFLPWGIGAADIMTGVTDVGGTQTDGPPLSLVVRPLPTGPDRTVLEQGVRVGFGVVAIVTELLLRVMANPDGRADAAPAGRGALDAVLGASWGAARLTGRVAGVTTRAARPVVGVLVDPPLVPHALRPSTALDVVAARWRDDRGELTVEAVRLSRTAVPAVVDSVAATLDLDLVIASVVDRLDLDQLVQHVLTRIDLDEAVAQAISELDLTPILTDAVRRVDLQPVVTDVIDQLDLAAVITLVLKEVDLTAIVTDQVDLPQVVNSALDEMDLTALVMDRVDLVGIADYVVDAIDLPGIVRKSTGSIASESVKRGPVPGRGRGQDPVPPGRPVHAPQRYGHARSTPPVSRSRLSTSAEPGA